MRRQRWAPVLALAAAQWSKKPAVELVTVILTVPAHVPQRAAIRTGYGQKSSFDINLWFVVSARDPGFWDDGFSRERRERGDFIA